MHAVSRSLEVQQRYSCPDRIARFVYDGSPVDRHSLLPIGPCDLQPATVSVVSAVLRLIDCEMG
jgi:hypothetical protein